MIKDFIINEYIHKSPITEVLRAKSKSGSNNVILKVRETPFIDEGENGLAREYRFLEYLKGENVVRPIKQYRRGRKSILVLEDDGLQSLELIIAKSRLTLVQTLQLGIAIIEAIEYVHSKGVIHGDINPANIIVNESLDNLKLIDFEHASKIRQESVDFHSARVLSGTLAYMSPEQTGRVNRNVDFRADYYAFGVILYLLISGELPFKADNETELIYSHIARSATPLVKAKPGTPKGLSDIVEILLRKSPEERYQTANGIKEDLMHLHNAIQNNEIVDNFVAGDKIGKSQIILPNKLYGRENEVLSLKHFFSKSINQGQIITVTGGAGVGKTSLIKELYVPITQRNGFFLSGNSSQYNQNEAYSSIALALQRFVQQCMSKSSSEIEKWKKIVQSSVGNEGQLLIDIVPEFQNLIGKQEDVVEVASETSVLRRNALFSKLLRDICDGNYPVVIFFDNIQWINSGTAALLEKIVDNCPKNLLLIISYRYNDVLPLSVASLLLNNFKEKGRPISNIHLPNLREDEVTNWIKDIFPDGGEYAKKLSQKVLTKTDGNPFYIRSLLQEIIEKRFVKNLPNGHWVPDLEMVDNIATDGTIVDYLIAKIEKLQKEDKELLAQISVLRSGYQIHEIAFFLSVDIDRLEEILERLVRAHLVVKIGQIFTFSHDKVQQAARVLLNNEEAQDLNLKIGKGILVNLESAKLEDIQIDNYIHHFNAANSLVREEQQRLFLAGKNYLLAKRLKKSGAFKEAESVFANGISFLSKDAFTTNYDLAINLHFNYGDTLMLNLKYELAEFHFETVIQHSKSPMDIVDVYAKQIINYATKHQLRKSTEMAFKGLNAVEIKLPRKTSKWRFWIEFLAFRFVIKRKRTAETLTKLPLTNDSLTLAQINLLSAAEFPLFMASPNLWFFVPIKMMRLTITKGNTPFSPMVYISYAILLCTLGETKKGYLFAEAAFHMIEKLKANHFIAPVYYLYMAFVHHWERPFKDGYVFFEKIIKEGLLSGEYEFVGFAIHLRLRYALTIGTSIDALLEQFPKEYEILNDLGKDQSLTMVKCFHQYLLTLQNGQNNEITILDNVINDEEIVPYLEERNELIPLAFHLLDKLQLSYLRKDLSMAMAISKKIFKLQDAIRVGMFYPTYHFFSALVAIGYCRKYTNNLDPLRTAKKSMKKLYAWSRHAPENYQHRAVLIEAELSGFEGKQIQALKLYHQAIELANTYEDKIDLGISYECMGRYLLSLGLNTSAMDCLKKSAATFYQFGVLLQSTSLSEEFNFDSENLEQVGKIRTVSTTSSKLTQFDLDALIGTIEALTEQVSHEALLSTLMNIVMQNSGATRSVYIEVNENNFYIKAQKLVDKNVEIFDRGSVNIGTLNLPFELNIHTPILQEQYLLKNFEQSDDEVDALKSILLVPMFRKKRLMGVMYLENNLMKNAFKQSQIRFLSLLSGQAAISIENSIAFENLNMEQEYSSRIIESSPSLICSIDSSGITRLVNSSVIRVTGYSKEEIIGANWWKLFFPKEEKVQVEELFEVFKQGDVFDYELELTCKGGEKKNVLWTSFTRRDDSGNILEVIGFGNDITERKKIEGQLRKSEHDYKLAQGIASMGSFEFNVEKNELWWSDGFYDLCGEKKERFIPTYENVINGLIHPDDRGAYEDEFLSAMKTGEPFKSRYRLRHANGNWLDMETIGIPLLDESERVIGIRGTAQDISYHKQLTEALKESKDRYKSFIAQTTDAVFCYEFKVPIEIDLPQASQVEMMKQITLVECNAVYAKIFKGQKGDKTIGRDFSELFQSPDLILDPMFKHFLDNGYQVRDWERLEVMRDGTNCYFRTNLVGIIKDKRLHSIWGSFGDITEGKEAQLALAQSEKKYRAIFDNANDGIIIIDKHSNHILDTNPKLDSYLGFSKEELIQKSIFSLYPKEDLPDIKKQFRQLEKKGSVIFESRPIRKDGTLVDVEISSRPFLFEGKEVFQSFVRDITDKKEAEKRIRHALLEGREVERNRIGMNLHDGLGQLLIGAVMQLNRLRQEYEQDFEAIDRTSKFIRDAIEECRSISHNLVSPMLRDFSMTEIMDNLVGSTFSESTVDLDYSYNDEGQKIPDIIKTEVFRICQEILSNSIKYSKASRVILNISFDQLNDVLIYYFDDGVGFNFNKIEKGIGLKNIALRVETLGGRMEIKTGLGEGTRIEVKLFSVL